MPTPKKITKPTGNVVVKIRAGYAWNVQGEELIYTLLYQGNLVRVRMRPYSPSDLIGAWKGIVADGWKQGADSIEYAADNDAVYLEFVYRNFLGFCQIEGNPSVADQLAWFEKHPLLAVELAKKAVLGVVVPVADTNGDNPGWLQLDADPVQRFAQHYTAHCPATGEEAILTLTHVMRGETEADMQVWARARGRTVSLRSQQIRARIDYSAKAKLYDDMVQKVEGMVIGKTPTAEDNKAEWVRYVPLLMKVNVIDRLFDASQVKKL